MAKKKAPADDTMMNPDYLSSLMMRRDKTGLKAYNKYLREHAAELRRLEREARGEMAPGDYDCREDR